MYKHKHKSSTGMYNECFHREESQPFLYNYDVCLVKIAFVYKDFFTFS